MGHIHNTADHTQMLFPGHRGGFTSRACSNQRIHTGLNLRFHQIVQSRIIHFAIFKRGNQRSTTAFKQRAMLILLIPSL